MSEPIEYELTAKDQELDAALRKCAKLADGLGKALDNAGQKGKRDEATKAFQDQEKQLKKNVSELDRFVASQKKLIQTPLERYTAKQEQLNVALQKGKLTQDEYARASQRSTAELYKQQQAGQKAFDVGDLMGQYVSSIGVATAGVQLLKAAWEGAEEASRKALESARGLEGANKDLAQLASPEKPYPQLKRERDALAVQFNLDRREATDLMFAADSAKLTANQTTIAARAGIIGDASDTALLEGKVKEVYKGQISPEAAVNVAGAASAKYPLNFKDFVQHMPTAMGAAKELGLSFEDVSSIVGNISTQTGTPAEAFARFGNLASKMARDDRFAGRGMAGFEKLAGMGRDEVESIFGKDQQTDEAIRHIRNQMSSIKADVPLWQQASKETGTGKDWLVGKVRDKLALPEDRGLFILGQQEKAAEIARERRAASEAARQAAVQQNETMIEQHDVDFVGRWAAGGWGSAGRWLKTFGASDNTIKAFGAAVNAPGVYLREGTEGLRRLGAGAAGAPAGVGTGVAEALGPKLDAILGTLNEIKNSNAQMVPGPAPRIPPRANGNGRP
jgi:hypothetical protein